MSTMSNSTDPLPSTATDNIIGLSSELGSNGTSILNPSHHLSALKAHVIAGIISVVVLIVIFVLVLMLFRRSRRIKSRKESNPRDRVTARYTTRIVPQTKVVIIDKLHHDERRVEYSDPSRPKPNCKINPDVPSPYSQRIRVPQPPSYSYYHMDDHNSPSGSSASSSFGETSPLDSTSYPFFDRSTGRTAVTHLSPLQTEGPKNLTQLPYTVFAKAVLTREVSNVDRYCIRPSRPSSRSPTPTNLEALETFVAGVEYEYPSDPPTSQANQSKSTVNGEPEKPETSSPVTPKNVEGSPEQMAEERASMIGRGESYYWKTPPRTRTT